MRSNSAAGRPTKPQCDRRRRCGVPGRGCGRRRDRSAKGDARRNVSSITSEHFIEHIDDLSGLIVQAAHVLVPGGTFKATAPHFSSPYFYSDPTHRRFFGLYTFAYLSTGSPFSRRVPTYEGAVPLRLEKVSLGFKSSRPFYGRHTVKRAIGMLIGATRWGMEFYEENLCWLFPCYGITYVLRRLE